MLAMLLDMRRKVLATDSFLDRGRLLNGIHLLIVPSENDAENDGANNRNYRQSQVDGPRSHVSWALALGVEIRGPDKSQVTNRVVHGQGDGSLLARTGTNVGHPRVGDLETAVGSGEHKEEGKVSRCDVGRGHGDDDTGESDDAGVDHVRRAHARAVRVPSVEKTEHGREEIGRCCEEQGVDGREAKVLDKCWQEVCQRRNSLNAHLSKNAQPNTMVLGSHLEGSEIADVFLLLASILNDSHNANRLLLLGQPLCVGGPIGNDKASDDGKDDCRNAFDDEEPAPTLDSVVLEGGGDTGGEETAKGSGKHGGAEEDSETETEFLSCVPAAEEESDADEEWGL